MCMCMCVQRNASRFNASTVHGMQTRQAGLRNCPVPATAAAAERGVPDVLRPGCSDQHKRRLRRLLRVAGAESLSCTCYKTGSFVRLYPPSRIKHARAQRTPAGAYRASQMNRGTRFVNALSYIERGREMKQRAREKESEGERKREKERQRKTCPELASPCADAKSGLTASLSPSSVCSKESDAPRRIAEDSSISIDCQRRAQQHCALALHELLLLMDRTFEIHVVDVAGLRGYAFHRHTGCNSDLTFPNKSIDRSLDRSSNR